MLLGLTRSVAISESNFIKRNIISLCFLVALAIYLTLNFMHMLNKQMYENSIKSEVKSFFNIKNNIVLKQNIFINEIELK